MQIPTLSLPLKNITPHPVAISSLRRSALASPINTVIHEVEEPGEEESSMVSESDTSPPSYGPKNNCFFNKEITSQVRSSSLMDFIDGIQNS
jgi:hypothetical protein